MTKYVLPQSQNRITFKQGSLDSLCGLYSAINAIQLSAKLTHYVPRSKCRILASAGLSYLHAEYDLYHALTNGLSCKRRRKLAKFLVSTSNDLFRTDLELVRLVLDKKDPFSVIEKEIRKGFPVCINLQGTLKHFSVISGYDDNRLYFDDSDGLKFIKKRSIGFKGDKDRKRHKFANKGVFVIRNRDPRSQD